jgi:hypothetical protein
MMESKKVSGLVVGCLIMAQLGHGSAGLRRARRGWPAHQNDGPS